MLQSLKRANRLDCDNPKLHSCLVRFYGVLNKNKDLDSTVKEVIEQEIIVLFKNRDAIQLNKEYLDVYCNSLEAALEGARMLHYLNPKLQNSALALVTNLDNKYQDVNINVSLNNFEQTS